MGGPSRSQSSDASDALWGHLGVWIFVPGVNADLGERVFCAHLRCVNRTLRRARRQIKVKQTALGQHLVDPPLLCGSQVAADWHALQNPERERIRAHFGPRLLKRMVAVGSAS